MKTKHIVPTNALSALVAVSFLGLPLAIDHNHQLDKTAGQITLTKSEIKKFKGSLKQSASVPASMSDTMLTAALPAPQTTTTGQKKPEVQAAVARIHPKQLDSKTSNALLPFYAQEPPKAAPQLALNRSDALMIPKGPAYERIKNSVEPLTDLSFDKAEAKIIERALRAIRKGRKSEALALKSQVRSSAGNKLIGWYLVYHPNMKASKNETRRFMKANPDWPRSSAMRIKSEQVYIQTSDGNKMLTEYSKTMPNSVEGKIALASKADAAGQTSKAKALIKAAWTDTKLDTANKKHILARYKQYIDRSDHIRRLDNLLYLDRRSRLGSATRMLPLVDSATRAGAKFRMAVIRRQSGTAYKLLRQLPASQKDTPGVHLATVQLLRRAKKNRAAEALLISKKFAPSQISDKDQYWIEQRLNARSAIAGQRYNTAYKIATRNPGPSINLHKEAEFLAGWTALRFLNRKKKALAHFNKLQTLADGPRSRSRAKYWTGRAYAALGDKASAQKYYKQGAEHFNTYYGQLSRQSLRPKKENIYVTPPPVPTSAQVNAFARSDVLKAILIADYLKEKTIVSRIFSHLRYRYKEPGQFTLIAELATQLDYMQSAVRIGKTALARNFPLGHYSYPVVALPKYKPLRSVPETSILYSIARQETEFNHTSVSHAGARGLLQVMPNTLKDVARRYKIRYKVADLTRNPAFNLQIASAYIGDRWEEFNGSYIMTFAGFNAGPGRVRQWVRQMGDPRSRQIDPVDWVEMIPFTETRHYVQKVLANVQVYRSRLGTPKKALKIAYDLHRGTP